MTQEEVARRVVKSRPAVANALRLLALPDEVRAMVSRRASCPAVMRAPCWLLSEADKRVEAARADGRHDRAAGRGVGESA